MPEPARCGDWLAEFDERTERRRRPRYPFSRLQYISFSQLDDPQRQEFHAVPCHDLSTGGFSYLADQLPPSMQLIVALGNAPDFIHVLAEVRYIKRLSSGRFHVGCKFLRRW
jgi:hypothetical protein